MVDFGKPFKRAGITHHGYAKPGDPIFFDGPMIGGTPMTELLGVSPKKATAEDKVAGPKGKSKAKGKRYHLRVLMASSDELAEGLFREVIVGRGHHLTILNPWKSGQAFIDEARTGGYDVVIVTNLGLQLDYSLVLIAPLRQSCSAKVIVMSGLSDQKDREAAIREGATAFYALPVSGEQILEGVEAAAR